MSSRAALRVAEQTGCLLAEAAATLQVEPDEARATEALRAVLSARRTLYGPRLTEVWAQFAGSASATETGLAGTIAFIEALHLQLEDPAVLAVMYELQAPRVGVLVQQGFVDGWARLETPDLGKMRSQAVPELRKRFEADSDYFRNVYRFTFRFNLAQDARLLPLDTAVAYWQLLLVPRYAIAANWVRYASLPAQPEGLKQGVSADTWNMVHELCDFANADTALAQYDEMSAWPVIIDDFVEWMRTNKLV